MTTVADIYSFMCRLAPPETQRSFDNAGFLVGHSDAAVKTVLLALDITDEVIDEAYFKGAQLIISHHPVIFNPARTITDCSRNRKLLTMAERGMAAICMHTNLDIAEGGVNDVLIKLLGAEPADVLDEYGCGRVGELSEETSLSHFLLKCKSQLMAKLIRYYDAGKRVKKIAVMGGSGASEIETAYNKGCDTYVTADIKYHDFQLAHDLGINLIDAGHFATENPIIPVIAQKLSAEFPDVCFNVSEIHKDISDFV